MVVGVLRGDEIVPIKLTPRRYDRTRSVSVCVPKSPNLTEYRSGSRSDDSCGSGYQLAEASFSVEGGDNDVDIDLTGPIQVILTPDQRSRIQGNQSEAATAAREKRGADAAKTESARLEEQETLRRIKSFSEMIDGEYIEFAQSRIDVDLISKAKEWESLFVGKVFSLSLKGERSFIFFDELAAWIALPNENGTAPAWISKPGSGPPAGDKGDLKDSAFSVPNFYKELAYNSEVLPENFRRVSYYPNVGRFHAFWDIVLLPDEADFTSQYLPALCFKLFRTTNGFDDYTCFRLEPTSKNLNENTSWSATGLVDPNYLGYSGDFNSHLGGRKYLLEISN